MGKITVTLTDKNKKKEKPKKFKLGESHVTSFEGIDEEGSFYFKGSEANREFHIMNILYENYKRTETEQIEDLLMQSSKVLQNYDIEVVNNLCLEGLEIHVHEGPYIQEAKYDPVSKVIKIWVNRKCLKGIKDNKNISYIRSQVKAFFVHEDTHRQQDTSSRGKFFSKEKYIDPRDNQTAYLNQRTEIDAYARQYGFELQELYSDESTDQIFKRIFNLDIDDVSLKNNLDVMLKSLTLKNQKFFLRNLYDYIGGLENYE